MAKEQIENMSEEYEIIPLDELLENLSGSSRRQRQEASHQLALLAREDAAQMVGTAPALIEALDLPEAQTRWEVLDALSEIALVDADVVKDAFDGAEASLFDEASATVRLSAFRFLCRYGALSKACSDKSWPLLDESIQCYHGDPEYRDMLGCLFDFVNGDISAATSKAVVARIGFDANPGGRDYIQTRSAEIVEAATNRKRKPKPKPKPKPKAAAGKAEQASGGKAEKSSAKTAGKPSAKKTAPKAEKPSAKKAAPKEKAKPAAQKTTPKPDSKKTKPAAKKATPKADQKKTKPAAKKPSSTKTKPASKAKAAPKKADKKK